MDSCKKARERVTEGCGCSVCSRCPPCSFKDQIVLTEAESSTAAQEMMIHQINEDKALLSSLLRVKSCLDERNPLMIYEEMTLGEIVDYLDDGLNSLRADLCKSIDL